MLALLSLAHGVIWCDFKDWRQQENQIPTRCGSLSLGFRDLGDDGAERLANALGSIKAANLEELNLPGNKIAEKGMAALAKAFESNEHLHGLRKLNLGTNSLGAAGATVVSKLLQQLPLLEELRLGNNNMEDIGLISLCDGIKHHASLTTLYIGSNSFGAPGAKGLAKALSQHVSLRLVWLPSNAVSDVGATAFADVLRENARLDTLSLAGNQIGDAGAIALAAALEANDGLQVIDLEHNGITDEGMNAIADSVLKNAQLKPGAIEVTGNPAGATAVALLEERLAIPVKDRTNPCKKVEREAQASLDAEGMAKQVWRAVAIALLCIIVGGRIGVSVWPSRIIAARGTRTFSGMPKVPRETLERQVIQLQNQLLEALTSMRLADATMIGLTNAPMGRLQADLTKMVFESAAAMTRGIDSYLHVPCSKLYETNWRQDPAKGVEAMRKEFEANGTLEDNLCLKYVLDEEAGSNATIFDNGALMMDCDSSGHLLETRRCPKTGRGMRLHDFVNHADAMKVPLNLAEVAALRVYSTAAYRTINAPLRDQDRRARKKAHPLPVTVLLLSEAAKKLRTASADKNNAHEPLDLYRGMRNMSVPDEFLQKGGTELAPMSATYDVNVAVRYSTSENATILRIITKDFCMRGADIAFLSAFPGEEESLFPPLTYLRPVRAAPRTAKSPPRLESHSSFTGVSSAALREATTREIVTATGVKLRVIDVEPQH